VERRVLQLTHFDAVRHWFHFHSSWPGAFLEFSSHATIFAAAAVSDEFITGTFPSRHGRAATFAQISRMFFPGFQTLGPPPQRVAGKLHFWLTFGGVYLVFMPMHWLAC